MTDKNSIINKCNTLLEKYKRLPNSERYINLLGRCDALLEKYKRPREGEVMYYHLTDEPKGEKYNVRP